MTALKSIFQKPVNRPIEGVIKADDKASLRLELEEYVLTDEVEDRLISFLTLTMIIRLQMVFGYLDSSARVSRTY